MFFTVIIDNLKKIHVFCIAENQTIRVSYFLEK